MNRLPTFLSGLLICLFCSLPVRAYEPDDTQADLRENEVVISGDDSGSSIRDYTFLRPALNYISLNGDDWSRIQRDFARTDSAVFSILQIGDSHIQADVSSSRTRDLLQKRFGDAGRGLITPLKICGTNEPYNYSFTTNAPVTSAKLLKMPWLTDMGFTGTAFTPRSLKYNLKLSTEVTRRPEGHQFRSVRLIANGKLFVDGVTDGNGDKVGFEVTRNDDYTEIYLHDDQTTDVLNIHSFEPVTIYGASLSSLMPGVVYHAIGNNGATFQSYNRLGSMGGDVTMLDPDLVIISLGTNEAFSKLTDDAMYAEIDYLVNDIRRHNPAAKILLTTPMECQKGTRVVRRSRSRSRRRVYSSSRNYTVNDRVKVMRDVILRYGRENGVATYDWYGVAGGDGSSARWLEAGLLSKDRIHCTFSGYEVAGDLLHDALIHALTFKQ